MSQKLHNPYFPMKKPRKIKNLFFVEGNCSVNFDGVECDKNDIIFLNQGVYWITNQ